MQVFDQQGKLLEVWPTELIGPAFFYVDADDIVYIPEHNGGMISILTLDGERLARWASRSSVLPRHLVRFASRHLRRAAGRMGPCAPRGEIRAAVAAPLRLEGSTQSASPPSHRCVRASGRYRSGRRIAP